MRAYVRPLLRTHVSSKRRFGPIAWLLISELFPLEVRGGAMAFAVANNFACNLVVSFAYPIVVDWFATVFGEQYKHCAGFSVFALLTSYALVFVYRHVPETKGMSLEEIERKLCSDGSLLGTGSCRTSTSTSSTTLGTKAGNGLTSVLSVLEDGAGSGASAPEIEIEIELTCQELTQQPQRNVIVFDHPKPPSPPQPSNGAGSVTSALHDERLGSAPTSFTPDERIAQFYGSPTSDAT